MTPREQVLKILQGEAPDRVPWFGDLDYWAGALVAQGRKSGDFACTRDYIEWHRDLGVGFYLQGFFHRDKQGQTTNGSEWSGA